jgi:hypothetical protein
VALLSPEHSASIIWNEEGSDTESVDIDVEDTDRLFTFEVAKRNEQEKSAIARPGFQVPLLRSLYCSMSDQQKMHSPYILHSGTPPDCPVNPAILGPHLLPGETTQGFFTATYHPPSIKYEHFEQAMFSKMSLQQLM